MKANRLRIQPAAEFCFGRHALATKVIGSAIDGQSVLLYGGRQAGKTTILKYIERCLDDSILSRSLFDGCPLGIYVNLLMLPFNAEPRDFYSLVIGLTLDKCDKLVPAFESTPFRDAYNGISSVDEFQHALYSVWTVAHGFIDGFLFLLDEAKRVLGHRFSRGFQDNLFTLLYGGESRYGTSIVFSGAQDLYVLHEDSTSPIGSRATTHFIQNLHSIDIVQMITNLQSVDEQSSVEEIAKEINRRTSGHAGTSARYVEKCINAVAEGHGDVDVGSIASALAPRLNTLYQHWSRNFTPEANVILDILQSRQQISMKEVAFSLDRNGFNRFNADMVCQELQYVGVTKAQHNDVFARSNKDYWEYRGRFHSERIIDDKSKKTWDSIDEAESSLRIFVKEKFRKQWPDHLYKTMGTILGDDAWNKLEYIKNSSDRYYPYVRNKKEREIMECMYFGQLITLMVSKECGSCSKICLSIKGNWKILPRLSSP